MNIKVAWLILSAVIWTGIRTKNPSFGPVYGIPLRVKPPELNKRQRRQLADLYTVQKRFKVQLARESLTQEQVRIRKTALKETAEQIDRLKGKGSGAAVDAEIALVKVGDYPLQNWLANPFFVGFENRQDDSQLRREQVMMVSRLDGPNPAVVIRMIDESLEVEKSGLRGKAYFDARWPLTQKKNLNSYALYDASLHKAASLTQKSAPLMFISISGNACCRMAKHRMPLFIVVGTVWGRTLMPLTGVLELLPIISPAVNVRPLKSRTVRSGARPCSKMVSRQRLGLWLSLTFRLPAAGALLLLSS